MKHKDAKVNEPTAVYQTSPVSIPAILKVGADQLKEPLSRMEIFRDGLPKKSFDSLKELSGLDYNTLANALGVSSKTLQRKDTFDTIQSEKIYELANLYAIGVNYFGRDGFRRWMDRPLFSLGNRRPLDLIDVSEGIDLLKIEIMRLQHGVAI